MKPQTDNPLDRIPESPTPAVGIWFALIGPPTTALLHVQMSYALEHVACSTGSRMGIHAYTLLSLLIIGWAGLIARRHWIAAGADDPGQLPGPVGTIRLMALLGMIGSGIFTLFVLAQWFPNVMLPVCIRT
ncbi:MAG TPA: hypothetical protein VM053_05450 [Gemmatimonadaceae bacterium]|nr:hypothetical protein [Gemmatimonadaceae bacterium]